MCLLPGIDERALGRSEGHVLVVFVRRGGGVERGAHGLPVTVERGLESASAAADHVGEGDSGIAVACSSVVVDERWMLREESLRGDVERLLEKDDRRELGR